MKHLTRWRTVTAAAASTALAFGALGIAGAMNNSAPIELATDRTDDIGEGVEGSELGPPVELSAESLASQASDGETDVSVAEATGEETVVPSPAGEASDPSLMSEDDTTVENADQGESTVLAEEMSEPSPPSNPSNDSVDDEDDTTVENADQGESTVLAEEMSEPSPPSSPSNDSVDDEDSDLEALGDDEESFPSVGSDASDDSFDDDEDEDEDEDENEDEDEDSDDQGDDD